MVSFQRAALVFLAASSVSEAFAPSNFPATRRSTSFLAATATGNDLKASITDLKRVLEREYISFFDPMERDYYSPTVSFEDPMTSLAGVEAYQNNVDMLASRTLMGKFLFQVSQAVSARESNFCKQGERR